MVITLAENFKKLRRSRDLTQEEIAQFLGISFQAVSKWERGEGYPDITMLPVIANYFQVTVDDLLGNDLISKEEKVMQYCEQYWNHNHSKNMTECVAIAKQAYAEYPYEWRIIEIYLLSLTRGLTEIPDQDTIRELRQLCEFVMEKCTDPTVRKRAVYTMIFVEDDEHVERWLAEAPDNSDFLSSERREERYADRQQWDLYYPQKQENTMDLLNNLLEKMGCYQEPCDIERKIESQRKRVDLLNAMFKGTDRILLASRYCDCLIELAMSLNAASKTEEVLPVLTEVLDRYEEQKTYAKSLNIPLDETINFTDPMWDHLTPPAFPKNFAFYLRQFENFAKTPAYADREEFQTLLARARSLNKE